MYVENGKVVKVRCVDNFSPYSKNLTFGKQYDVICKDEYGNYIITNDQGYEEKFFKRRFEEVVEDALKEKVTYDRLFEVKGVNKDTPIVEAEPGCEGKQSPTHYRFDLLDPKVMFILAEIVETGTTKYGINNWREIPWKNHLNKAAIHMFSVFAGDTQDDHLGHCLCRVMMAIGTYDKDHNEKMKEIQR